MISEFFNSCLGQNYVCHKSARQLLPIFVLTACASTSQDSIPNTASNLEVFKGVVSASTIIPCKEIANPLKIPSKVSFAKVLWSDSNHPQLLYQGAFRDSMKTVLQPLNDDFEADGDGLVLGPKNENYVTDFAFIKDALHNTWAKYRVRAKETQLYYPYVEFLSKSSKQIARVQLPVEPDNTAQQLWVMPFSSSIAEVVVRYNSIDMEADDSDRSSYIWYEVDMSKNSFNKRGEFKSTKMPLSIASFSLLDNNPEPVTFAVAQVVNDKEATSAEQKSSLFKIIVAHSFSQPDIVGSIAESASTIGSLAILPHGNGSFVAWTEDKGTGINSIVHWTDVKLGSVRTKNTSLKRSKKKGRKAKRSWKDARDLLSTRELSLTLSDTNAVELRYYPTNLGFRTIPSPAGKPSTTVLTWSLSIDSGIGYIFTRAQTTKSKASKPAVFAIYSNDPKGELVGFGEAETLGSPELLITAKHTEVNSTLNFCKF